MERRVIVFTVYREGVFWQRIIECFLYKDPPYMCSGLI